MADRPLIKETLFLLNFVGLDPCKHSAFSEIRFFVTFTLITFCFANVLLECLLRWDGLNSNEAFSFSLTIYLILVKAITIRFYWKSIMRLLTKMENFWPVDKYGVEFRREIEYIYILGSKSMKLMVGCLCALLPAYLAQPIFGKARKLFLPSYYPEDLNQSPQFEMVFVIQSMYLVFAIIALLGVDGFFVSLIINIASELKYINRGFQTVPITLDARGDSPSTLQYLNRMIDHHNLTLGCIKILKNIFSVLLLNAYACNIILICGGLLGIVATGFPPTLLNLYKYGSFSFFYILEFFFYCFTGTYLISQSECVSSAIYDSKWWIKTQPEMRRACVFIIQRANKKECLTAGGMYALDLESFGNVIKNSLSFFTLVQAMYGDDIIESL